MINNIVLTQFNSVYKYNKNSITQKKKKEKEEEDINGDAYSECE